MKEVAPQKESFDFEKSPVREAYVLLGAKTPLELSNLYTDEDQKLMKFHEWDYNNPDLTINKIKEILENVNLETLSQEERKWAQEIIWFWYHHAISCAIWRYKDRQKAKEYSEKALSYQTKDHPNKITRLLNFLSEDKFYEAEVWTDQIEDEVEKTTALELLKEYKEGGFF